MTTEPTDAELKAMWQLHAADIGGIFYYARAVLAKWGQPAQAAEPVAWLRNTTDPQPHAVTNLKYRSAVDAEAGVEYIPVFAAPQPVEREPLSDEQIEALPMWKRFVGLWPETRREIVRIIEAQHGIKGGQHGTE